MSKAFNILLQSNSYTATVVTGNSAKKTSSPSLLQPKTIKQFKLTDIRFQEESYFKGNKFFRPMEPVNTGGILGDPKPYSVSSDNTLIGLLIICFILAMFAISMSRNFINRQLRTLFKMPKDRKSNVETYGEMRFQVFLFVQAALLLSIIYNLYNNPANGEIHSYDLQMKNVGIYFALFVIYFLFKRMLYSIVNWVYFNKSDNQRWLQWWFFITSIEGLLLFPLVLLLVYFNLSMQVALIYTLSVTLLIKLFTMQKQYAVFFKSTNLGLQIILYFCALEIMPLTALAGILIYVENFLKINF